VRSHALTTRFRDLELEQRRVAAEMAAIIADGEPRNIAALDDHHSMREWRKANANRFNGHAAGARNPAKALEALPEVGEALLVDIVVDQRTFEEELARRGLIPEPTDLRDVDLSERRCETTNGTAGWAVVATTGPTSQGHRQATPPSNTATARSCTTGVTAPRCCPPVDATPTNCPTAQDWSTSPTSTNSLASPPARVAALRPTA
jgi:hypothetical protein